MDKQPDSTALYQNLADDLSEEIRFGVYTPGGRLPSIRDMAEKKGVSQTTVQRAYQILEREGTVHRVSTWGYFVNREPKTGTAL
ncbi:winged helix-turn-helix domain-containing protein [Ruminococcaceae bacterium OttesenSCG-928-L11]|nr:winged helix-turn-helix domain-containing protein [Ruminococcaceae bacterium OttesenSCG-928-L11]